jgi:hypothetical protein
MIRTFGFRSLNFMAAGRDVNFTPDDGLHAASGGLVVEMRRGEEIAVIGDGNRWHAAPRGFRREFSYFTRAVEKRVIRV